MLDLQARVHFDEIEFAVLVQEFDRAGAEIADLFERPRDGRADLLALGGIERGARRFFPHLLVAALQRAVAFAQMQHLAKGIGQHLHFDVARLLEVFFDIDGIVAEGGFGLGARGRQRHGELGLTFAPPSCRARRRRPPP